MQEIQTPIFIGSGWLQLLIGGTGFDGLDEPVELADEDEDPEEPDDPDDDENPNEDDPN